MNWSALPIIGLVILVLLVPAVLMSILDRWQTNEAIRRSRERDTRK